MPHFTIVTILGPNEDEMRANVTTFRAYEASEPKAIPEDLLAAVRKEAKDKETELDILETDPDCLVISKYEDWNTKGNVAESFGTMVEFELWLGGGDVEAFRKRVAEAEQERERKMKKLLQVPVGLPEVDIETIAKEFMQ
jgi:hypothetical protein